MNHKPDLLKALEHYLGIAADWVWGTPLLILLLGGGLYFMFYSRFIPFRHFGHAVAILRGKYDDPNAPGDINHFQALSSALAATVGMGNISGVAVAIYMGGPGALFWMWMSAFVGMATKYFTCTLAILYRGKDSNGDIQGGPMYVIMEKIEKKWKPLAVFFSLAGLIGPLPIFQANQLTQILRDGFYLPSGLIEADQAFSANLVTGLVLVALVSIVIFGGIKRIGYVASRMVPFMVALYVASVLIILGLHIEELPYYFWLIIHDAFTGDAVLGGSVGAVIIIGVRRAAFSNEAGIGTEALAHGAAQTNEPVREGLVAMLGPAIDTLLVCTMTALAILVTGVWETSEANGVTLTMLAFEEGLADSGSYLLLICVIIFSTSSMLTYSYYGSKCFSFLFGAHRLTWYNYLYIVTIVFGSVATIGAVINLIDTMFALMAIPTMVSAVLLSPKVMEASRDYFRRLSQTEK